MHTQTLVLKGITLGAWLAIILNQFVALPEGLSTFLNTLGIFLVVAHALECLIFAKKIIANHSPAIVGFVQVFLFGIIHLRSLPNFQR